MTSRQTAAKTPLRASSLWRMRWPAGAGLAAALAVCAATAQAQVFCPTCDTYNFSIGPLQGTSYVNHPDGTQTSNDIGLYTFGGSFRGHDPDGDGHIQKSELVEFHFGGLDFPDGLFGPGAFGSTQIASFDYSPMSGLSVSASNGRFQLATGVSYVYHSPGGGNVFSWRTDTVIAVPEPASWLGLSTGLALLAVWRPGLRRRQRARAGMA